MPILFYFLVNPTPPALIIWIKAHLTDPGQAAIVHYFGTGCRWWEVRVNTQEREEKIQVSGEDCIGGEPDLKKPSKSFGSGISQADCDWLAAHQMDLDTAAGFFGKVGGRGIEKYWNPSNPSNW